MKFIAFILSMPNKGSWDGKWTGEKDVHARILRVTERAWNNPNELQAKQKKALVGNSFTYDFGDGWTAQIDVRQVTEKEAIALKKRSVGFAGYDWMIASLIHSGDIHYESNWQIPPYMFS